MRDELRYVITSFGRASIPASRASIDKPLMNRMSASLHPQNVYCLSRYSVAPLTELYRKSYLCIKKAINELTSLSVSLCSDSVCSFGISSTPLMFKGVVFSVIKGEASALSQHLAIIGDEPSLMPEGTTGTLSSDE